MWKSIVAVVVCLLSSLAWGQPLADKVPEDAILYVGWQGSQSMPAAYAGSRLKGVLDASEFSQLLDDFLPRLMQRIGQENPQAGRVSTLVSAIAAPLWRHPSAFYFGPLDLSNPDMPMPSIALYCDAGAEAPALLQQLQEIIQEVPRTPVPLKVTSQGNLVIVTLGKEPAAGGKSLAGSAAFQQALVQVQKEPIFAVYVNAEAALKFMDEAVAKGRDERAKENWPKAREALGLGGLKQIICTGGFDGKDWGMQAFVAAPAPRAGLLALIDNPPLKDDIFRAIPPTATMVGVGQFDLARFIAEARTVIGKVDPNAQQQFDQGLQNIHQALGLDVQKDILGPFGPAWASYIDPTIGGSNFLGLVVVNHLNDPVQAEKSLMQLEGLANAILQQQMQQARMTIRFNQTKAGDLTINYLALPLVTPAWTIKDGNLYAALYPQVVASAARHVGAKGKSILDNEQFIAMRKQLGGQNATSIRFADLSKTAPQAYGGWLALSRYTGFADLFGVQSPAMLLPPLPKLMEQLAPAGAVGWTDQAGWHAKSVSSFPGSEMVATDPVNYMIGQAPLMASIMLPSLNRARETANRVKSASNERQIGMAIMMYANENAGKCPDDLGTLLKTQEIGAEVFICPGSGKTLPPNLNAPDEFVKWVDENSDYVYVGKGKKVAELGPEDVVVYERPGLHGGDGINILFGDGHVEWRNMSSATELIKKATEAQPKAKGQ